MGALAVLENFGEIDRRRSILETSRNPKSRLDYTIGLERRLSVPGLAENIQLTVRYIPDIFVLNTESFDEYCALLAEKEWESLEAVTGTIIDDFNNELIPRWIEVSLKTRLPGGETDYEVVMDDRQPSWTRQALLTS